jgi:hypothetical protein
MVPTIVGFAKVVQTVESGFPTPAVLVAVVPPVLGGDPPISDAVVPDPEEPTPALAAPPPFAVLTVPEAPAAALWAVVPPFSDESVEALVPLQARPAESRNAIVSPDCLRRDTLLVLRPGGDESLIVTAGVRRSGGARDYSPRSVMRTSM